MFILNPLAVFFATAILPCFKALHLSSKRASSAEPSPTSKIVYIKTHATASSTLTGIFHRFCDHYHFNCFVPPYFAGKNANRTLLEDVLKMKKEQNLSWDVWPNHANLEADLFDQIIPNNTKVSIFRNPLDRLASSWAHAPAQLRVAVNALRQNQPLKIPCGPEGKKMTEHVPIEDFDKLDYVLLTEHMNLGLVMMKRKFNWQLSDIMYVSLKTSTGSTELKDALREMLVLPEVNMTTEIHNMLGACVLGNESLIYNMASDKFYQQWKELGASGQDEVQREVVKFEHLLEKMHLCCQANPADEYCIKLSADNLAWNGQREMPQGYDLGCRSMVDTLLNLSTSER